MPRRRHATAETALVPHRSPDLAALLDEAKTCELAPLRRFLAAGGHPDTLVPARSLQRLGFSILLLMKAITMPIAQSRASVELLLSSWAKEWRRGLRSPS
jgi:hypothetical protein